MLGSYGKDDFSFLNSQQEKKPDDVNGTTASETDRETASEESPAEGAPGADGNGEEEPDKGGKGAPAEPPKKAEQKPKKSHEGRDNRSWATMRIRIKNQQKRIKALEEELGRKAPEGETPDQKAERLGREGYKRAELDSLKEQNNQARLDAINARFEELYPSQKEKSRFYEAWEIGERNGAKNEIENDSVVRDFLAQSEYGARLIEHFFLKPEKLREITSIEDTDKKKYRLFALQDRLEAFLANKARAKSAPDETEPKQETAPKATAQKPQIKTSVIGRQTAPASKTTRHEYTDEEIRNIQSRGRGLGY